ncbi:hypothetical protein F9K85_09675 [Brucella tritici]|uniref:hypothetical protein n=1 Tax=Brucella tritici TaxID=94626 RepID=UPI00124EE50E|nr:hypothetical protein [Brucella tritici]KAB2676754.1 hypothetical protein F9K85_09675 [Brucella tritici]
MALEVRPIRNIPGGSVVPTGTELIVVDNGIRMAPAVLNEAVKPQAQATVNEAIAALALGTASQNNTEDFATAAQGVKADSAVQSVNGKSGTSVSLDKSDVGLSNVDNTSDADKPVSVATQTALDAKANSSVNISAGTGLTGGGNLTANRSIALNATSIASLEKADSAVQTVNGVAPVDGDVIVSALDIRNIDTAALVSTTSIPGTINFLRTAGYSTVGDGGAALYKRVGANPNIGPTMVTNGGFTSDTGWTKTGGATITGDAAVFNGNSQVYQTPLNTSPAAQYVRVEYRLRAFGGGTGSVQAYMLSGGTVTGALRNTVGVQVDYLQINGPVTRIAIQSGNVIGAEIEYIAFNAVNPGQIRSADGTWWEIVERVLRPEMFGVKGDGSDETTILQGMLNISGGKDVVCPYGANYGFSSLTFPIGLRLTAKGASFTKLAASSAYAIVIPGYVTFDNIVLTTPGGGPDMGVRVNGDFVTGDVLQAVSTAEATGFGVRIEGTSAASRIGNVRISRITTGNFSSQIQSYYVSRLWIGDIRMTNYVTGFYIRDTVISRIENILASGAHSAETGGPGNNGVLLESTDLDYGTDNVTFGTVTVKDSAEHAVRLGGSKIMRSVHFDKISAFNTGALGNTSTGGAAFKALLDQSNPGQHEDITVDSVYFEDCSNSTNGVDNHTAIQISQCRDGYVNNVVGRKKSKTYSCIKGIQVNSSNNFHFDNPDIRDAKGSCFYPVASSVLGKRPLTNVKVTGGMFHVLENAAICQFIPDDQVFTDVSVVGTEMRGGRSASRYEAPASGGSYVNCAFEAGFAAPVTTPSGGVVEGGAAVNPIQARFRSNIPTPVGFAPANGSTWQDYGRGEFYIFRSGAWVAP